MTRHLARLAISAGWLLLAGTSVSSAASDAATAPIQPRTTEQPAIQLGAYEALSGAESDWRRLSKRFPEILGGLQPSFTSADLGSRGVFQRLQAGPFADQSAAKAACEALIAAQQKCLVTRMRVAAIVRWVP